MVYKASLKNIKFIYNEETNYKSIYTKEERDTVVAIYARDTQMNLFDGCAIRLDSMINNKKGTTLELSKVSFFDFIVTNILREKYDVFVDKCISKYEEELISRLKNKLYLDNVDSIVQCMEDVLVKDYMSNILAISIVLEDIGGNILLVRRGEHVAVAANIVGVSVTGVLDESDYGKDDPFIHCAIREIKEELGVDVVPENVSIRSLVAGVNRLQPIILCDVRYEGRFENLMNDLSKTEDFFYENNKAMIMTKSEIKEQIDSFVMTEAGKQHLYEYISN